MASATHAGCRDRADVGALVVGDGGLAGGDVHGAQRPRHGRDRLHGRSHPQQLAGRHAALGAAGASARASYAVPAGSISSCARPTRVRGQLEAVTDLDALDRLDAHQGAGQPRVEPPVPVDVGAQTRAAGRGRRPRRHRRGCRRPGAPRRSRPPSRRSPSGSRQRTGSASSAATSSGVGTAPAGARRRPSSITCETSRTPAACSRKALATRPAPPARPSRGRWPARGPAGPRRSRTSASRRGRRARAAAGSGARCAARPSSTSGSTGSGDITCSHFGHSLLAISIATGPPMRRTVADPAEDRDLVRLEVHPGAAPVAEASSGQHRGEVVGGERDVAPAALRGCRPGRRRGTPRRSATSAWRQSSMRERGRPDPAEPGRDGRSERRDERAREPHTCSVSRAGHRTSAEAQPETMDDHSGSPHSRPIRAPSSMNGPNGTPLRSTILSRASSPPRMPPRRNPE